MRLRNPQWLVIPAVALALLTGAHLRAREPATPQDGGIRRAMGDIDRAVKALNEGIHKDNVDASLDHLLRIQKAILDAKAIAPPAAEDVDEKKRDKYVAEYRVMMLDLLKQVCDAEAAVVEGKYGPAEKIVGKFESAKGKGHGKFNPRGR